MLRYVALQRPKPKHGSKDLLEANLWVFTRKIIIRTLNLTRTDFQGERRYVKFHELILNLALPTRNP